MYTCIYVYICMYMSPMNVKVGAICRPPAANCTSGFSQVSGGAPMNVKVGAICRPPAANCTSGFSQVSGGAPMR